ncbi:electron transfer flavo(Alpha-subunit) FixB domain protein [Mycobacterium xenopi 4042]|uniref:Electron transfer flavo(Alpha-subunit) FixB domain protein n=1 Tax=Mycobacterium xenopi 4042 TaxID=1299334 RepID=X7Z4K8_MYCXE|nr:electron transfer flavo(Alpha-subunit) FixB domain protein [Mycobacterium xenopi 4042]
MAEVLVLVEHAEGALKKVTAELLTAARRLGEPPPSSSVPGHGRLADRWAEGRRRREDLCRRVRHRRPVPDHPTGRRTGQPC